MCQVMDMDRMYFVQKCNEWMRGIDFMYLEVRGSYHFVRGR